MRQRLALFFSCLALLVSSATAEVSITTRTGEDAVRAYGYYLGQKITLERITREHPSLAILAKVAEIEFNLAFGDSVKEIDRQLYKLGTDQWTKTKGEIHSDAAALLAQQQFTLEQADAFIEEVIIRADARLGNIPNRILKTLLLYSPRYQRYPVVEWKDNYRQNYANDGSGKSKGLAFEIQAPKSWVQAEGNRPNIPVRFTSTDDHSLKTILVLIKKLGLAPGEKFVKAEIDEFVNSNDILSFLPEGATYIASGSLTLENQPGFWITYKMTAKRMQLTMHTYAVTYSIFVDNYMLRITGSVGELNEPDFNLDEEFHRYKPLFDLVANSLVLPGQYR